MARAAQLDVALIAATRFQAPSDVDWSTDTEGPEALIEFAGRACYETFDKPNPRTATNAAYVRHIMEVGHAALFEHATATMYIRGISRAATHEFLRHRHFSFSQLSQRFTHDEPTVVLPPAIADDEELSRLMLNAAQDMAFIHDELLSALEEKLGTNPLAIRQARQAARYVFPAATESRMVVTGNYRTWRHFIAARATEHADVELRTLAIECLRLLQAEAPTAFGDFDISTLADGTEMATSPYVAEF